MPILQKITKSLLDTVFPIFCLGCGSEGAWLCDTCRQTITPINKPTCPACRMTPGHQTCSACKEQTALDGLVVSTGYDLPLTQTLLHTLKYGFAEEIARSLAEVVVTAVRRIDRQTRHAMLDSQPVPVLVPVPLHPRRYRERGFNQSELLASRIGATAQLPMAPGLLARQRYTTPQARLKRHERLANLSGAFSAPDHFKIRGKNVILIDDVATTLATLNECAKVLKAAGSTCVWGLVIARGS